MVRRFWLEVTTLVVVSLVLGSRGSRKDSGTKLLDDLLEKIPDSLAKNDKCKGFDSKLPPGCSITEDCFHLTCARTLLDKDIILKMKVNRCDEPFSVTIDVKVEKENVEWSHVFSFVEEEVAVGKTDIYVRVEKLKDEDGKLTFEVNLEVRVESTSGDKTKKTFKVMQRQLPISTEHCGLVRWWFHKNTAVRISVTVAFLLVASVVITCGCFCGCCCCCKPCKKRSKNRVV